MRRVVFGDLCMLGFVWEFKDEVGVRELTMVRRFIRDFSANSFSPSEYAGC